LLWQLQWRAEVFSIKHFIKTVNDNWLLNC